MKKLAEELRPIRQYPRVGFDLGSAIPTEVRNDRTSQTFTGWITTLGARGAFLEVSDPFPVGSSIALRFLLPGYGETIVCSGIVRDNVPGHGVGVEFTQFRPSDRDLVTVSVMRAMISDSDSVTANCGRCGKLLVTTVGAIQGKRTVECEPCAATPTEYLDTPRDLDVLVLKRSVSD